MADIKLNEEQLGFLKVFIKSKSFRDPAVIIEILDHIACKVEDIMNESKSMPFENAVKLAHHQFGVRGFRPIATAYEAHVEKKYKSLFWKNIKKSATEIQILLPSLISGLVVYKAYLIMGLHGWLYSLGMNMMAIILFTIGFSTEIYLRITSRKKGKNIILYSVIKQNWLWLPVFYFYIIVSSNPSSKYQMYYALVYAIFAIMFWIYETAKYKTLQQATIECDELGVIGN